MPEIKSTRLRYISASSKLDLVAAIDQLPFKVELKGIVKEGKKWVAFFVIPENKNLKFQSVEFD